MFFRFRNKDRLIVNIDSGDPPPSLIGAPLSNGVASPTAVTGRPYTANSQYSQDTYYNDDDRLSFESRYGQCFAAP